MVNPITMIGKQLAALLLGKHKSDELYKNLIPSLRYVCQTKGRSSVEAKGLMNILAALPASGARARNFKKEYVDKQDGWKKLPDSPDRLPFGYWH